MQGAELHFLLRALGPALIVLAGSRQIFPGQNFALNEKIIIKDRGRSRQQKVLLVRLIACAAAEALDQKSVARFDRGFSFFGTHFLPLIAAKFDRTSKVEF